MSANERQVGGTHYKVGGEEHWDRVHRLGLDYFQAQITKYVERWTFKNGVEDLEKARHFLDKYIELKRLPEIIRVKGGSVVTRSFDQLFVYEGGTKDSDLYQCKLCKQHLETSIGELPAHECGAEPSARGYVDQDGGLLTEREQG